MHRGTNSTIIALIPKNATPCKMQDFRPISLCTVMYKCISKILASRLQHILPSLIDKSQSAFIQGRQISDNILVAQELFRGYNRNSGSPQCAIKVDLFKAFDSINWNCLFAVMEAMDFPVQFLKWIKACVCTYYVLCKDQWGYHWLFQRREGVKTRETPFLLIFLPWS